MNNYSAHFFDRKNFVFAVEALLSVSDAEAIVEIRERQLPRYCAGFELWRGERLLYRGVVPQPARAGWFIPDLQPACEPLQAAV